MNISSRRGFTLIELMVVIAIIAILSGILLANFTAARSKSRDGQRISDISQIQLALAGYFNQCNQYPTTITLPSGNPTDTNCPAGINLSAFISKVPTPPAGAGQTAYSYVLGYASSDTGHTKPIDYVLGATLENNSSVSNESLTTFPPNSVETFLTPPITPFCDSTVHYCVTSK